MKDSIIGTYQDMLDDNLRDDGMGAVFNCMINIFLVQLPYVNVIVAVRALGVTVFNTNENVKNLYRMLCYSDMVYAYKGNLNPLLFDTYRSNYYELFSSYDEESERLDKSDNYEEYTSSKRYLENLAQLRIMGEKEYYYFVNSREAKENINSSISYVKGNVNKLGIKISERISVEI